MVGCGYRVVPVARFRIETKHVRTRRHAGADATPRPILRFRTAILAGIGAIVSLSIGSALGNIHGPTLKEKLVALIGAFAFLGFSIVAIQSVAGTLAAVVSLRAGKSGGTALRIVTSFVGYMIVIIVTLGVLAVPVQHLLLGGALTGVIVGIAAQQALGNVFAGLVLLSVRPFTIDERVRVRSGSLNGPFDGTVRSMTLTYVTIETDEGPVNVPNSAMLAAAVGPSPEEDTTDLAVARAGAPPLEAPEPQENEKRLTTKTVLARAARSAVKPHYQHPHQQQQNRR